MQEGQGTDIIIVTRGPREGARVEDAEVREAGEDRRGDVRHGV